MKKGSSALRKLYITRKCVGFACVWCQLKLRKQRQSMLLIQTKVLMKMDYSRRTLRSGRINHILSTQDNVILSMQTIYRTFLEAISSGHLSFLTLTTDISNGTNQILFSSHIDTLPLVCGHWSSHSCYLIGILKDRGFFVVWAAQKFQAEEMLM